ncbi:MAG: FMN-dependent NADH-azoreductase [Candidatus Nomurabacteria bacterium GW2011_GWF2_35_66]|uniref:FMN-dependent NADH-azoreductase n=1 Tax=Candidatus Nomurabacteria bacterium GW2011_GWE1_35_16 TaxID=1618761 RepID=A0A0G0DTQ8_9BACT|nr:MAG: FMN-dependent NADH-azoreductase [Candidatus Nomurabacteria bacterium GW2011_GWF1_34_20]KKP62981.1 MAG: FMN-dependent NADH-azoreductase [Candidatus Nomurabacteria bacterium GW2011_GWE2_34_25]KKP66385.1 MAG: FMN-dependent NADH-azoreductase [Candidatus Nomurabacteria bacterium GW2011_GWE1_35_16]KKP83175.1 MAG: FMN-dependent NADH-azoreductase [Candidatus Nomurabacteria bacterium GW2011_GWF2_35_66]HAE36522.1 hypothetical protein [Candidatus Nomurabacteria bacterium]
MKIIALSTSPSRNRNSDTMLDNFIIGMNKVAGIEVEKIYLEDIPIDFYNYENSTGPALHEEKFRDLIGKIENSDGLVIATPTYNFSVPARLKNFIDRIRFLALDLTKHNKFGQPVGKLSYLRTYFIVSGGTPNWAETILFFAFPSFWLRGVFLYFDAKVLGAFYTGNIKAFEDKVILDKCIKKGERYANMVKNKKGNSILERIFWRAPQV